MLLFAAMFCCLDPVLTIAASLSFKDAFIIPLVSYYGTTGPLEAFYDPLVGPLLGPLVGPLLGPVLGPLLGPLLRPLLRPLLGPVAFIIPLVSY